MKYVSKNILFIIFLCVFAVFCMTNGLFYTNKYNLCKAEDFVFDISKISDENISLDNYSEFHKKILYKSDEEKINLYKKIINMGISQEEVIRYLFPSIFNEVQKIAKNIEKEPKNAEIKVLNNQCLYSIVSEENGVKLNKNILYSMILYNKLNKIEENVSIYTSVVNPDLTESKIKDIFVKRGEFETNFKSSSEDRKTNIKKAIQSIDGKVLLPGEVFSFNECTGERGEKEGYKRANIINNGQFVESYGGGVCQVSTTLYNACLRAGLEIVEVNPHSLAVSYVNPGFDAMVNMGVSDLKIKNNTNNNILITGSSLNDICRFVIYGERYPYKIVTRSVIKEEIEPATIYESDLSKFNKNSDEFYNEQVVVYPKSGFKVEGIVDVYDKDKTLIVTRRERKVTYKPINKVVYLEEKL